MELVHGKRALIKSVSSFANADQTALLIVGFKTERIDGRDTVVEVAPVPGAQHTRDRYQQIIDSHITPKIRGLRIDLIDAGGGGVIVVVTIPAQRAEDKWFRARRPGRQEFDVFVRRGEGTARLTAEERRIAGQPGRSSE